MFISPKIKIIGKHIKENFYCNLCNYPLLTLEDFNKEKLYQCCHECYLSFIESRKNEWKNGWRTNKKEIDSYISIRNKLYNKKEK